MCRTFCVSTLCSSVTPPTAYAAFLQIHFLLLLCVHYVTRAKFSLFTIPGVDRFSVSRICRQRRRRACGALGMPPAIMTRGACRRRGCGWMFSRWVPSHVGATWGVDSFYRGVFPLLLACASGCRLCSRMLYQVPAVLNFFWTGHQVFHLLSLIVVSRSLMYLHGLTIAVMAAAGLYARHQGINHRATWRRYIFFADTNPFRYREARGVLFVVRYRRTSDETVTLPYKHAVQCLQTRQSVAQFK